MTRSDRHTSRHIHWVRGPVGAVLALALALALAGCGGNHDSSGGASSLVTISIAEQGTADPTAGLAAHIADELGYFAEEGIKVEDYVTISTSQQAITGMASGSIQFSMIGADGFVAFSKGADILGLAAIADAPAWTVLVDKSIKDWSDLKGKTIALSETTGITPLVWGKLAEQVDMDMSDFKIVALGATPSRIAAVQAGQASATLASFPSAAAALADGDKFRDLGPFPSGGSAPKVIATELVGSRSWVEKHPDETAGFLRAIKRAVDYIKDPSNEDDVTERTAKLIGATSESIRETLRYYFYEPVEPNVYYPDDLRHQPDVFEATVNAYLDAGMAEKSVEEDDYVDYSYLDAALNKE